MAKRRKNQKHSIATKREVAQAMLAGQSPSALSVKYNVSHALPYVWRDKYKAGELGPVDTAAKIKPAKPGAKLNGHANGKANELPPLGLVPAGKTPEALFTSRVNLAISHLRQAYKEVERMKTEGKIKGPDKAHSYAYMALLELQGDNSL